MANDLTKIKEWMDANGDTAGAALSASIRLARSLNPIAQAKGLPVQEIFSGIPAVDDAIAQSAGVAEIAGAEGVTVEDVLTVTKLLLGLGLTFV